MMRVAFDIGGTFTDFVLEDARAGALHFHKVPTTPGDPAKAVLDGLEALLRAAKVGFAEVSGILHATTVATNAILERKGVRTALITTAGFRDIVIIGRQKRYDTYDMYLAKPVPLVRRRDIFEVAERILADGTIEQPLDAASLDRVAGAGRRRRLRVGRRLPAARLRRARAREGHRRGAGPRQAPDRGLALLGPLAQVPRVRAHQHGRGQRLHQADRQPLRQPPHRRAEGARAHERPLHHAVERRSRVAGARLRHADPHRRVRARGWCPPVRRDRPRGRPRPRAHLRHGRHHGQARRHRRRRARHHADLRGRPGALPQGQRPPHQRPRRRAVGDRRRRRQHRRDRHGPHQGRPRERRRRPRPRLLPPRRRAPDRHRRQRRARLHQSRLLQRRRHAPRRQGRCRRHCGAHRQAARPRCRRGRLGHPPHRQRQHGAGHAHRLRGAGARPAQVCARRLRRRRPAARGAPRPRARHPARHRPLRRRRRLGHRHAGGQLQARRLDDAPAAPRRRRGEPRSRTSTASSRRACAPILPA